MFRFSSVASPPQHHVPLSSVYYRAVLDLPFSLFVFAARDPLVTVIIIEAVHLSFVVNLVNPAGSGAPGSRAAEKRAAPLGCRREKRRQYKSFHPAPPCIRTDSPKRQLVCRHRNI